MGGIVNFLSPERPNVSSAGRAVWEFEQKASPMSPARAGSSPAPSPTHDTLLFLFVADSCAKSGN